MPGVTRLQSLESQGCMCSRWQSASIVLWVHAWTCVAFSWMLLGYLKYKKHFACQTNHNPVDTAPHQLCYLFSNEWLLHRSSCNPINNRNFITPVALMLGRCQSEGLWVISYVNESNLQRTALPRSLLKGKLLECCLVDVSGQQSWHPYYLMLANLMCCKTCYSYPPSQYSISHAVNFLTYYLVFRPNHVLERRKNPWFRILDELKMVDF